MLNDYLNLFKSAKNLQSGLYCPHCRICHKKKNPEKTGMITEMIKKYEQVSCFDPQTPAFVYIQRMALFEDSKHEHSSLNS